MLLLKKKKLHAGVNLTQREKEDSLVAAKLMFQKHSGINVDTTVKNTRHVGGLSKEGRPEKRVVRKTVPVNKQQGLSQHKTSTSMKTSKIDARKKQQDQSCVPGQRKPNAKKVVTKTIPTPLPTAMKIKPINPLAAQTAAALAHSSLTDMETEWDLPLWKSNDIASVVSFEPIRETRKKSDNTNRSPSIISIPQLPRPSFTHVRNPSITSTNQSISRHQSPNNNISAFGSNESIPVLNDMYLNPNWYPYESAGSTSNINRATNGSYENIMKLSHINKNLKQSQYSSNKEQKEDPELQKFENIEILPAFSNIPLLPEQAQKTGKRFMSPSAFTSTASLHSNHDDGSMYEASIISGDYEMTSNNFTTHISNESNISPPMNNNSSSTYLVGNSGELYPDLSKTISTPSFQFPHSSVEPIQTIATYGTLSKIGGGTIKYQGTLPDLIPNHVRKTRIDKLKTKFLKNTTGIVSHKTNNFQLTLPISSLTSDGDGRAVVKTAQNFRFKTTMRKTSDDVQQDTHKDEYGNEQEHSNYDSEYFTDETDKDDYDLSDNNRENNNMGGTICGPNSNGDKGKKVKKRERLKKKIKSTAASVPLHYYHHGANSSSQIFNEDKPWKSHNDYSFITESERKRYESMWVSNRYLYLDMLPWWSCVTEENEHDIDPTLLPPSLFLMDLPEDGLILNLVVKDIWARSNIPSDLLMQIYNLVDTRKDSTLDRKSFIVGMWLVDQCLYGRKLPRELDQSVWESGDRYMVDVIYATTRKVINKNKKKMIKEEMKQIKKEMKNIRL